MFEENKHCRIKKRHFKRIRTYSIPNALGVALATTPALRAQLVLITINNFTNITSFGEDPQSTVGDGENIMLASTVPVGNDRLGKGKYPRRQRQ